MHVVVNVTLPVFAVMLAGFVAGRTRLLGPASSEALNGFVYYVALPPLLFLSMARAPLAESLRLDFLLAYGGGSLIVFLLSAAVGRLVYRANLTGLALGGMAAVFANTGYLGIPLFIAAFGVERTGPAILATIFGATVVMAAVVSLIELDRAAGKGAGGAAAAVARALAANPLVMSALLGILAAGIGVPLPRPVVVLCELLGAAAGPCALFAIGLFLASRPLALGTPEVAWLTVLKLLLHPVATWWLAFGVLDMEPFWAGAAVLLAALPTAALVFVLAQKYGAYVERSSAAILVTTVLSVLTISAILVVMGA